MAHVRDHDGYEHAFICDGCGAVAGEDNDEAVARERAFHKVNNAGWKAFHPGWRFRCPRCQPEGGE